MKIILHTIYYTKEISNHFIIIQKFVKIYAGKLIL